MRRRFAPALAGAILALLCAATAPAAPPTPRVAPGAGQGEALVYTVTLKDTIHPITARFIREAIERANRDRAALLILKLDTPGGFVTSMEDIVKSITDSRVPIVVYVNGSHAASAGFFITIAADVAVMAPGTRTGAAHPVSALSKEDKASPEMEKVENDVAAYARSLATNRGRNVRAAEDAVRKSSAFTEQEALKLGLIDLVCSSEGEILEKLDGRVIRRFDGSTQTLRLGRTRVVSLDMTTRERFLSFLANPTLAVFLFLAGLLGLYVEFTHPGMVAPGLIGVVCLLLFALATQLLPINWVGVGLIMLAVVMFILEIKVPSYGMLTIGGIACLIVGSMMLIRKTEGDFGVAGGLVLGVAAGVGVIMAILTTLVVRSLRRRPTTGMAGLVAEVGTALTDLDPEGSVFVHGEYWNARARRPPVRQGARVRIVQVRGLLIEVEEVP
jgi:membrane-bound serine protease (ClpP class)